MRKLLLPIAALALAGLPAPASAQRTIDLIRFQWISGFLNQGDMATAAFVLDSTPFGGTLTERSEGGLDVDPSVWYGIRGTYRYGEHLSFSGSWMHSRGRFRVQFPALASIDGNFDLEGLILAGEDFTSQGEPGVRAESALNDALTDVFLVAASWEWPILDRWAFPFVSVGTGIFKQKSDGQVIEVSYERNRPARVENAENVGLNVAEVSGLSAFRINETDLALSFGLGMRVALSDRWGVEAQFEDLIRVGADLSDIDESSTPPADPNQGRFYSTTFVGTEGTIHNFGLRVALNYAIWPYGAPR